MEKVKFNKKQIIKLIEAYYKLKENKEVKATITVCKDRVGYYEEEACIVKIIVKEEFELLGVKEIIKKTIDKNELANILNDILLEEGYIVETLDYDAGLNPICTGYGLGEKTELKPYFKGVEVGLEQKVKKFIKK